MFLKSLQMQGFKSFPEKTILNFEEGITGVVGPNGSGKSNISDAVRWVLGEQSGKSIRASKMEDVIFDGTKSRKPFGYAQVTLILSNEDRAISSIDDNEVSVSRRCFRSGESEYRINGDTVRLKDIHQLFMDTGLGRDGYSLVSQGKVADLVSDKNSKCREMLEEAAGISSYRYRRSEANKKLNQAEDNLVRINDIISELEKRVEPLRKQSEKAKKFLEYSEEKRELDISLWIYEIERFAEDAESLKQKNDIASNHFEECENQINSLNELIELSIENAQKSTASIDEARGVISSIQSKISEINAQIAVFGNSIEHNSGTIVRIENEVQSSNSSNKELEDEIRREEDIIGKLNSIVASLQSELKQVDFNLQVTYQKDDDMKSKSASLSELLEENSKKIAEYNAKINTSESLKNEYAGRLQQIKSELSSFVTSMEEMTANLEKTNQEIKICLNNIQDENNVSNGLKMLVSASEEKLAKLDLQIEEVTNELSTMQSQNDILLEMQKNMEGYSGSVKAIINNSNKLSGICGIVSELISVDEKYALAIETALGASAQHIICSTDTDAKRAVEFLKSSNLGRATFQPISSVKGKTLNVDTISDEEGFVGIASDLVNAEGKYNQIILSLLGRIVIVEDLDYAVDIARAYSYSFKIVTLDGQVVNAGGSITGGSKVRVNGGISRKAEINRLQNGIKKLSSQLDSLKQKRSDIFKKQEENNSKLFESQGKIISYGEERIRLNGLQNLYKQQIESFSANRSSAEGEELNLSKKLEEQNKIIDDLSSKILQIQTEIEQTENSLSAIYSSYDDVSTLIEKYISQKNQINSKIHNCEKDLAEHNANVRLMKLRLSEDEDKQQALKEEIQALKLQNKELTFSISKQKNEIEVLQSKQTEAENNILVLQNQRMNFESETNSLRQKEKKYISQREQLIAELARLSQKIEQLDAERDKLIASLYEEYEISLRQARDEYSKPENVAQTKSRLRELRIKIKSLGSVNVSAIEEYKEVKERYDFMSAELLDVEKSRRELQKLITELTKNMSELFYEKFEQINSSFSEIFSELFGGGTAKMVLSDTTDILESEIELKLQPPGKNIKRLDSLSGGEKGLSAISLLFAILKVNPSPFCIFDEVEAALDDVNVARFAQYVRKMCNKTQFIVITHRRGTMEEADRLYGVTMQEQGVSTLLELKTAEMAAKIGIE